MPDVFLPCLNKGDDDDDDGLYSEGGGEGGLLTDVSCQCIMFLFTG